MGANFLTDMIEIEGYRFDLIWPSLEKVDVTTDWILRVDMDTKEFYGGYIQHDTSFLKKFEKLRGQ